VFIGKNQQFDRGGNLHKHLKVANKLLGVGEPREWREFVARVGKQNICRQRKVKIFPKIVRQTHHKIWFSNKRTLLCEYKFEVSTNQFDHILMLRSSDFGVWLSIRGSSIIHLYDKTSCLCKLLFNVRTNDMISFEKVDPHFFNYS
jgi:hypothetical protein